MIFMLSSTAHAQPVLLRIFEFVYIITSQHTTIRNLINLLHNSRNSHKFDRIYWLYFSIGSVRLVHFTAETTKYRQETLFAAYVNSSISEDVGYRMF